MPELSESTAIIQMPTQEFDEAYSIAISEFDAAGRSTKFTVRIPPDITSKEASVMMRAAILKKTTWKEREFLEVYHAVMYSDRMGLDIMVGDVYPGPGGRLATTTGAKIRHAMATGRIEGYNVEITEGEAYTFEWEDKKGAHKFTTPNLKSKVTVWVRGWKEPVVYDTNLAEWFLGTNPNWRTRPAYMLRRNSLSKALEEVAPMGVEADEQGAE